MNRNEILALFASAAAEPWAIRREYVEALRSYAVAYASGNAPTPAGAATPDPEFLSNREFGLLSRIQTLGAPDDEEEEEEEEEIDDVERDPADDPAGGADEDDDEEEVDARAPRAAVHPATERATARKAGSVAVVRVCGVISSRATIWDLIFGTRPCSAARIVADVTEAVNDPDVKAIVVDYDSPGGSVMGVQEGFDALLALRGTKPIIAQVSGQCASAAYWLAAAADEIVATESAMVGSIGAYMTHEDISKFLADLGVATTFIQAGAYKTETTETQPLGDEARAHLQETVDDYMAMFAGSVAKGRGVPLSTVLGERFGQGRAYVAARAQSRGLVDKIRSLGETLAAYGVTAGGPPPTRRGRPVALLNRELDALEL